MKIDLVILIIAYAMNWTDRQIVSFGSYKSIFYT